MAYSDLVHVPHLLYKFSCISWNSVVLGYRFSAAECFPETDVDICKYIHYFMWTLWTLNYRQWWRDPELSAQITIFLHNYKHTAYYKYLSRYILHVWERRHGEVVGRRFCGKRMTSSLTSSARCFCSILDPWILYYAIISAFLVLLV